MSGPAAELEAISQQLEASNPELYRHLALYLQVLREVLPSQVEQACFHLVTQLRASRYSELPVAERQQLHRRTRLLVRRCCNLITVDQLAEFALQMHRQRRRQSLQEQHQMLRHWQHQLETPFSAPTSSDLPPGSVALSLALPLSPLSGAWDPFGGVGPRPHPGGSASEPISSEAINDPGRSAAASAADPPPDPDVLRALADACSTALVDALHERSQPADPSPPIGNAAAETAWSTPGPQGRLPIDPLQLLLWLDGVEQALARRLRNLSHGLNVELRRCGITTTVLPVSLLDAVLAGQLESQSGPAHLLRVALPFGMAGAVAVDTHGLLIRQADLEMEEPRLRTCRRRLHQHRLQVVKMAQQYRRLQRRVQVHQAERLWLQDIRATQQEN